MVKYLIIGLVAVGILVGCQHDTPVTPCKGKILSIDYYSDDAEVVYQTNDGKYHEETYDFDNNTQRNNYKSGEKIICYVRGDGYVQEITKD
jgi:hypothetical protein